MPVKTHSYLRIFLIVCSSVSCIFAAFRYCIVAAGISKVPFNSSKSERSLFKNLRCIWYAWFTRRMLSFLMRTPLRKSFLPLINFTIPVPADSGCVIAICHSPWKRILVQWCLENKFALIIGGGKWSHQKKTIQRRGAGYINLRNIVQHLKLKGRIIIAADYFNSLSDCPVKFLGNTYNASILHIRLAAMAKVPLLTVAPKLSSTSINFIIGPESEPGNLKADIPKTADQILSFFEKEIERDPSIWSFYVK